jgi:tetratricopeptide (TPR) repeat protein
MASFFGRLKERKLFQWALAYAAGAWALLEGVDLVGGQFDWPQRLLQSITILVAVGFFVVLVLAWYHGEKGQQKVSGKELAILTVVLGLGGGLLTALPGSDTGSESAAGNGDAGTSDLDAIPPPREGINRVSLILADFENHTTDPHLGLMTTEALRVDLAGSRHLALLERGALETALRRMQMDPSTSVIRDVAVEMATREGVPFVVAGQVDAVGGAIQFLAEVVRIGEDTSAGGRRAVAADSTEILSAIGELARGLREDTGESARSVAASAPLPQVTTGSLEALRLYARALRLADREGEWTRAAELLQQAVETDTAFAMGYRKLGAYLWNSGTDRTRSIDSFRRAYLLRDRLTEPEQMLAEMGYYSDVVGDMGATIQVARAMLESYPNHQVALTNLAFAYVQIGMHEQAAEAHRHNVLSQPGVTSFWVLSEEQIALGRFSQADQALSRFADLFPASWWVTLGRVNLEKARGDYRAAERHLEALESMARTSAEARFRLLDARVGLHLRRGQLSRASAQLQERHRLRLSGGSRGAAIREVIRVANLYSRLLADRRAAETLLDQVLAEYPSENLEQYDFPYIPLMEAYAWAGRPGVGRELLVEYEKRIPSGERGYPDGNPGIMERVLSQLALAEGATEEAVRLLREGLRLYCHPAECSVLLAMAHEEAARPDSAMAWYERYLTTARGHQLDDEYLAPTLERLARLHDEQGDPARAEELYAQFVQVWEEADTELQSRVEAARARLGR